MHKKITWFLLALLQDRRIEIENADGVLTNEE